jgi:hypothetical protein
VKIYVVAMGVFRKKEGWGQNWIKLNLAHISKFDTPLKVNIFFCRFFFNLTRFWTKLKLLVPLCQKFLENSILSNIIVLKMIAMY